MGWGSKLRVARVMRGGKKVKRDLEGWVHIDPSWDVTVVKGVELDIIVVRHRWSLQTACTFAVPRGVIRDAGCLWFEELVMALVRKAAAGVVGGPVKRIAPEQLKLDFPTLVEYLFDDTFADGAKRSLSTITLMAGDVSGLKCVLNDRAEGMSLWATGEGLEELLLTLEELLRRPDAPWRRDVVRGTSKK